MNYSEVQLLCFNQGCVVVVSPWQQQKSHQITILHCSNLIGPGKYVTSLISKKQREEQINTQTDKCLV